MPSTAIFLTQDEYDGIISRLAAVETAGAASVKLVADLQLRVQSAESTLSAFTKTMADVPKLAGKAETAEPLTP